MTSTVTNYSNLIDETYPIPGADNDTKGFRDNFGNIKNALTIVSNEISDLQVIQTAIMSVTVNKPSSVYGTSGDILGQTYIDSSTIAIAYNNYVNTSTPIWNIIDTTKINESVKLTDSIPPDVYGASGLTKGLIYADASTIAVSFNDYSSVTPSWNILDTSHLVKYVDTPPDTSMGNVGDKKGMVYIDTSTLYVCFSDYVDSSTKIWGRVS